jgi:hypothetical protein
MQIPRDPTVNGKVREDRPIPENMRILATALVNLP